MKGFEFGVWNRLGQPFCWVFGRAHWAVSLYGANVFVDQVMGALPALARGVHVCAALDLNPHRLRHRR